MNKKFQVFISSTYTDLKEERKAVEETVIRSGDIPVGMEAFPAADDEQFAFIKTVIDACDYYILIIAGRYGSTAAEGLSYTEKEYRYAVSKGIPVLFFLHGDREGIAKRNVEDDPESVAKLEKFIELASTGRLRKNWTNIDALKLGVREALDHAKATKPRPGWVRGDTIASHQALVELAELKSTNDQMRLRLGEFGNGLALPELPQANAEVRLSFFKVSSGYSGIEWVKITSTFENMLPPFLSSISEKETNTYEGDPFHYLDVDEVKDRFVSCIAKEHSGGWRLDDDSYEILMSYYIEMGILSEGGSRPVLGAEGRVFRRRLLVSNSAKDWKFDVLSGSFNDDIPF